MLYLAHLLQILSSKLPLLQLTNFSHAKLPPCSPFSSKGRRCHSRNRKLLGINLQWEIVWELETLFCHLHTHLGESIDIAHNFLRWWITWNKFSFFHVRERTKKIQQLELSAADLQTCEWSWMSALRETIAMLGLKCFKELFSLMK